MSKYLIEFFVKIPESYGMKTILNNTCIVINNNYYVRVSHPLLLADKCKRLNVTQAHVAINSKIIFSAKCDTAIEYAETMIKCWNTPVGNALKELNSSDWLLANALNSNASFENTLIKEAHLEERVTHVSRGRSIFPDLPSRKTTKTYKVEETRSFTLISSTINISIDVQETPEKQWFPLNKKELPLLKRYLLAVDVFNKAQHHSYSDDIIAFSYYNSLINIKPKKIAICKFIEKAVSDRGWSLNKMVYCIDKDGRIIKPSFKYNDDFTWEWDYILQSDVLLVHKKYGQHSDHVFEVVHKPAKLTAEQKSSINSIQVDIANTWEGRVTGKGNLSPSMGNGWNLTEPTYKKITSI